MPSKPKDEIPRSEWFVAAVGLLLVLGSLSFVIWQGTTRGDGPPDIRLRVDSIFRVTNGYVVRFEATNAGEQTAANVQVVGALLNAADTVETAAATLAFVPAHSRRRAGIIFRADPRRHQIRLHAKGFEYP